MIDFNKAHLNQPLKSNFCSVSENIVLLVDDGAPYSAIGYVQFLMLQSVFGLKEGVRLESIPKVLTGRTHWQYGTGKHASASCKS